MFVANEADIQGEEQVLNGKERKKARAGLAPHGSSPIFAYHPEDDLIARVSPDETRVDMSDNLLQYASHMADFSYTLAPDREQNSFGVDTRGRIMIVPYTKLSEMVEELDRWGTM